MAAERKLVEAGEDPHDKGKQPFSDSKTSNWVARAGGLPTYIQHVAHKLVAKHGESEAIQMAIGIVKNWASGKTKVHPAIKAAAAKAVGEWEAKKAGSVAEAADAPLPDLDDRLLLIEGFTRDLHMVEGIRKGLRGKETRDRAGRVDNAFALLEGRSLSLGKRGNVDARQLARAQSMLGQEAAVLRQLLEAFGAPPPPVYGANMGKAAAPQAKGRNGQSIFDESKHPRAGSGSPTGGQFISSGSSGPEVKGVQRAVGAKADGKFGPETKRHVEAFQEHKGLTVDGKVGAQTAAAMNGAKGLPGPLLSHHPAALRSAKERFSPANLAAEDAKEKRQNKAHKARKEVKKEIASEEKAAAKKARQEAEGKIKPSSSSSTSSGSSSSTTTASTNGGVGSVFGEGSSLPPEVASLIQKRLGIATTGEFDANTKSRVEEFQKNHGLQVDGIVGAQTLAALRGDETPPAPGGFTQNDWTWLSEHQAGGKAAKAAAKPKPTESQEINSELGKGTVEESGSAPKLRTPKEKTEAKEAELNAEERRKARIAARSRRVQEAKEKPATMELVEATADDDFHRKWGAGMKDQPDEATLHLQNRMTELGYDAGESDGRFGDRTRGAVEQFQSDHGLKKDGEVGSSTKIALRGTDPEEVSQARIRDGAAQDAGGADEEEDGPEGDKAKVDPEAKAAEAKPKPKEGETTKDGEAPAKATEPGDEVPEEPSVPESDEDEDVPSVKLEKTVLTKGTGVADEPDASVKHMQKVVGAEPDGRFGPDTEKKLKGVQRKYGLKADGVVGPKTGRLLDRMATKAKPPKDEAPVDQKLNEAVLRRMEASVIGGVEFIRARADERRLRESSFRDIVSDATRDFYRLSDGTFAPKGRGQVLKPGEKINLPHRSGSGGKVSATVEHASGGRGLARINDGPEKGKLASVRTAAPAGSSARSFPSPISHRSTLPPAKDKPSLESEVISQNHLDSLNDAIASGSDGDAQDVMDDMAGDAAWSEKQGHGAANKNYAVAKDRGDHFLAHGEEPPMHAPVDPMSASDAELDDAMSGSDKSQALAAASEKQRRAKKAFDGARSTAAKEAASSAHAQATGKSLMDSSAMAAPPENYEPNAAEKQLKDMSPGDHFYVGKHDQAYVWHKPTPGGPFIISKPVGGGKAKVFHQEFAPPFIGPSDPGGSPSSSAASVPAPPATNENDLYDALKSSLISTGAWSSSKPDNGIDHPSPARSGKGNLRNFKAMSDDKLTGLAEQMKEFPEDTEAIKAITAELKGRADKVAKKADLPPATENSPKTPLPDADKSATKVKAAWQAYDLKKAAFDALSPDADKKTKSKAASQMRAAKFRIKRVGGDPKKRPDSVPEPGKKTGTPVPQPKKSVPDKPKPTTTKLTGTYETAAAKLEGGKPGDKFTTPPGGEIEVGNDGSYWLSQNGGKANFGSGSAALDASLEEEEGLPDQGLPSDAELPGQQAADAANSYAERNLNDSAMALGPEWNAAKVAAALDDLETQGIVFDREKESPSVIAAVIKAANLEPKGNA